VCILEYKLCLKGVLYLRICCLAGRFFISPLSSCAIWGVVPEKEMSLGSLLDPSEVAKLQTPFVACGLCHAVFSLSLSPADPRSFFSLYT